LNNTTIFAGVCFCINLLLIITFFQKDTFYTNMRYILFANTLLSDCVNLIMTNLALMLAFFRVTIQVRSCLIIVIFSSVYNFVTPVTLTAMALERYVAICMPLRHAELCTLLRALQSVLIVHCISCVPCLVTLTIYFISASFSYLKENALCSVEVFIFYKWQGHLRSALSQFYFLVMSIIITFSYIQIMKVAKVASGENKESTQKGLRTVLLHGLQLLLCLIQLWSPLIESAALLIDYEFFVTIRFLDYIFFNLAPRCLCPLIYGLRDKNFNLALKQLLFCYQFKDKVIC
uniref:G-protein coupled receptors family 1 profile domain-containing protein n=1 Tax=Nothobranchius furzeri TaxID=105023 RepID=A0A8C6NH78_NOTFU